MVLPFILLAISVILILTFDRVESPYNRDQKQRVSHNLRLWRCDIMLRNCRHDLCTSILKLSDWQLTILESVLSDNSKTLDEAYKLTKGFKL